MFEHLKEIRKTKGYTVAQMAKELGVTKATYSKKENGKIVITLKEAQKIAALFKSSVDNIFF